MTRRALLALCARSSVPAQLSRRRRLGTTSRSRQAVRSIQRQIAKDPPSFFSPRPRGGEGSGVRGLALRPSPTPTQPTTLNNILYILTYVLLHASIYRLPGRSPGHF